MKPSLKITVVLLGALLSLTPFTVRADEPIIRVKSTAPLSITGGDDLAKFKSLRAGVGWEFSPNDETADHLKKLGVKYIRCINVDPLPGAFDEKGAFIVGKPYKLDAHLATCRQVGAIPHVCLGIRVPRELELSGNDLKTDSGIMGQQASTRKYWNGDWEKIKAYWKAYFEYVLITNNFPNARFEVGNEPDIDGPFPRLPEPGLTRGSIKLYDMYFQIYKQAAQAAAEFENERGIKVTIGGPAITMAYSFRFGSFNWIERFLQDCAKEKTKLDFIGIHYYGNYSSLTGNYQAFYPSFKDMLKVAVAARDTFRPATPIILTEWGPSYITDNSEASSVNASHIGAAWTAEFINLMLDSGIDDALYLVTTDLAEKPKETGPKPGNIWGWPSLFVNPNVFGKPYPKPIFHVFEMISRLEGGRVESNRSGSVRSFCVASKDKLQCLIWNYNARIPEHSPAVEMGQRESVILQVGDAAQFFKTNKLKVERWLVSESVGNALQLFKTRGKLDDHCRETKVASGEVSIIDGVIQYGCDMPASSVSLVEITPVLPVAAE